MQRARQQKAAVEAIVKLGGTVEYDYEVDGSGNVIRGAEPPGPARLRRLLGDDFFTNVVGVGFMGTRITDAALQHLKRLTQLKGLSA